jgi:signal transduction histidine kinase
MKLDKFLRKLEQDYAEEKAKEAEELHNAIAQVLAEHKAEIQTVLYVLEMVRFEVLQEKYGQLFSARSASEQKTGEPKPGEIRFGKPAE